MGFPEGIRSSLAKAAALPKPKATGIPSFAKSFFFQERPREYPPQLFSATTR